MKGLLVFFGAGLLIVIAMFSLWPFRRQRLIHSLELLTACEVSVKTFTPMFSPTLGYHAAGLSFTRKRNGHHIVLATVKGLTGEVSALSLLTWSHKIESLHADGLHVLVPIAIPKPPAYPTEERLQAVVERVDAAGATLQIQRKNGNPSMNVSFPKLEVANIGKDRQMTILATAHNEMPATDLSIDGVFGPFVWSDLKRTSLSGTVAFKLLDLSQIQGAGGTATGKANLSGPFNHLRLNGSFLSPNFYSRNSQLTTSLSLDVVALLDGANGNTWFQQTRTRLANSELTGYGSVVYDDAGSRHTELFLRSTESECDDIFKLFLTRTPPFLGKLSFQTHSEVVSGTGSLPQRLMLTGNFRVAELRFQKREIQTRLDKLQHRIRKSRLAGLGFVTLTGDIAAREGLASLSNLQLNAAGLTATGGGNISLSQPTLALHGQMKLDASLSQALGGWKGLFALPINHFVRGKDGKTVLPFELKGPMNDPQFKTSLKRPAR